MGGNIVYTLLLATNHDWSFSLVANCKIKSCLVACTISITLPLSTHSACSVTSLTLFDVNK